jgi:template-activating factor I
VSIHTHALRGEFFRSLAFARDDNDKMAPEKDLKPEVLSKIEELDKELMKIEQEEMIEISTVADTFYRKRLPVLDRLDEFAAQVESFWAITIQRHRHFESLFDDREWDILYEYLTQVHVEALEEHRKAFRLTFRFTENPYFENETLVKDLVYADGSDGPQEERISAVCYPIRWKPGHSLLNRLKSDGFFGWFLDDSADWGETFLEDLYPNALNYYRRAYDPSDDDSEDDNDDDLDDEDSDIVPYVPAAIDAEEEEDDDDDENSEDDGH